MKTSNIRDMVVTTSSGTDVKNTQQLKGEAEGTTAAQKATNSTTQYETKGGGMGAEGGGKPSGK